MKKIFSLIFVFLMVFPVTACGKARAEEIGTAWGAETIPAADTIESPQETVAVPDSEAGEPEEETIIRGEFDMENYRPNNNQWGLHEDALEDSWAPL